VRHLIVRVSDIFEAQTLIDYFNKFSARAYRSSDDKGMTVVLPCDDPLEMGRDAAGRLGREIRAYGMMSDGTKYSLLNPDVWSKSSHSEQKSVR
jgi:hypothetical protein